MDNSFIFVFLSLCCLNVLICYAFNITTDNLGIIGGHKITIDQAPYMASLRNNRTYHVCGASIIHERYALSAAHCIKENRSYTIVVGTEHIDKGGDFYDVDKIIVHEKYNKKTSDYDICVIRLAKDVKFGPYVQKITLMDSNRFERGTAFNVTGWGRTNVYLRSKLSNDLLQARVPWVPIQKCRRKLSHHLWRITPRMICAGKKGRDTCQGDSGGPMTLNGILVGVASFGYYCGIEPGVYTRIYSVLPWITSAIAA